MGVQLVRAAQAELRAKTVMAASAATPAMMVSLLFHRPRYLPPSA
jgi:hypothetical protein